MAAFPTIRLNVPGTLAYRGVAVRVVAEACRLVSSPNADGAPVDFDSSYDLSNPFDAEFVSAFAEIFNNIAIHAYARKGGGTAAIQIDASSTGIELEVVDTGQPFDIDAVPEPELDALPEGGMGIHIARTMLDEVEYTPGPPNRWRLVKRFSQPIAHASGGGS